MSHSRKHVVNKTLLNFPVPDEDQHIVRVTEMRGTNVVEVEYTNGDKILCLMPAKFRKRIWIKKGNYLIIEPFTELVKKKSDRKLKGRISHILYPEQIKYLKKIGRWPPEWAEEEESSQHIPTEEGDGEEGDGDEGEDENQEDPYFVNTNRQVVLESESDESSEEGDE